MTARVVTMAYHRRHDRRVPAMNRVTVLSAGFLLFALAVAGWVLTRDGASTREASTDAGASAVTAAGLTFAEWSVRGDAILLADIDPGAGTSTVPRRFVVFSVRVEPGQPVLLHETATFSWAPASRIASASSLTEQGFQVSTEGTAFTPPPDPLFSDPIPRVDGGGEQRVTLCGKSGKTTTFVRKRGPDWNKRAIGFPSSDRNLVYVTPDATVIVASPP